MPVASRRFPCLILPLLLLAGAHAFAEESEPAPPADPSASFAPRMPVVPNPFGTGLPSIFIDRLRTGLGTDLTGEANLPRFGEFAVFKFEQVIEPFAGPNPIQLVRFTISADRNTPRLHEEMRVNRPFEEIRFRFYRKELSGATTGTRYLTITLASAHVTRIQMVDGASVVDNFVPGRMYLEVDVFPEALMIENEFGESTLFENNLGGRAEEQQGDADGRAAEEASAEGQERKGTEVVPEPAPLSEKDK